ncbi:MAG: amino acid ABC transporter permease, partial [Janthinobacterium lividum]
MTTFTLWDIVRNLLLAGRWTVVLALATFLFGGTLGLVIMFLRTGRSAALRRLSKLYIELFQGTPLLMQLFLCFFGLALFGVEVPAWLAAGLSLTLWSSAYLAEIWRGCVEAIAKGQWEASSVLAMNYGQQMRHVILPQALRIAIAPTVGVSVQIVK